MSRKEKLTAAVAVLWTIVLAVIVIVEIGDDRKHLNKIALSQAEGAIQKMLDIQTWNMSYGGVYVDTLESTPENLKMLSGDAITSEGRSLAQVSFPKMLTQISSIEASKEQIDTHLASLKPINPANKPDQWERKSLEMFEKGTKVRMGFYQDEHNHHLFRYMKPIYIEKKCLGCHAKQGYKEGDVRAGIGVTIHINELIKSTKEHAWQTILTIGLLWMMGLGACLLVVKGFRKDAIHIAELQELSISDDLTGLYNRRGFLTLAQQQLKYAERHKLKCLLLFIDLNNFKQINDTYGHKEGNVVLIRMARILQNSYRESDIVGRFGGDEFVVLAMGISAEHTNLMIGRLQEKVERDNEKHDVPYELSISIGMAEWDPENPKMLELLVIQADEEMYVDKYMKNREEGGEKRKEGVVKT